MPERRIIKGWIVERRDDGTLVPIAPADQGAQNGGMPSDPTYPFKGPQAGADLGKTNADISRTITTTNIERAKAPGEIAKTSAEGDIAQGKVATGAGVIGEAERAKALAQISGARSLGGNIRDIQEQFDKGPGATRGVSGLLDYIPDFLSPTNQAFNNAAGSVRGNVKNALGLTGGENNSLGEQRLNMGSYIADTYNFDSTNEDIIKRLRKLQNNAFIQAIQTLGGIPDASGRVAPLTPEQTAIVAQYAQSGGESPDGRDIITALSGGTPPPTGGGGNAPPPSGPGGGGTTLGLSRGETFTTPQDLAVAAAVNKAFRAGGSVEDLVNAARSAGGQITPEDLANFNSAIEARKSGQAVTFEPQSTGKRTGLQQFMGNAIMNPAGTGLATAVSGTGLNILDGLLPEQMKAIRALNPNSASIGDVAGAIGGTQALGKLGARAVEGGIGRVAPDMAQRLLGGGGGAQFARNALADTIYGTSYGQNVNGDALQGAIGGTIGSVGGQLAGKAIGATVGGVRRSAPGQYLADKIGDLTIGQQLGGFAKNIEDAATSIPVIGDLINARRNDSLRGLNRAAFKEVAGIDGVGQPAMDALSSAREAAYTNATAGRYAPLDSQSLEEITNAAAMRERLMPDYQAKFDTAMQNRVTPMLSGDGITGDQYQQAMRGLNDYKGARGADGFENDYRDAIGGVQGALRNTFLRSADADTVGRLGEADRLYRGEKIIADAIGRNRKDAMGIGSDMFRPSDLTDAVYQNSRKFNGIPPLQELARAAQEVIPSKLADSGTARRAMVGALATGGLGGVVGGGAGFIGSEDNALGDAAAGSGAGATAALTALALAALGGTKAGQRQIGKLIFERPNAMKSVGEAIRRGKRKGLFGAAAVPFLLEGGNQ